MSRPKRLLVVSDREAHLHPPTERAALLIRELGGTLDLLEVFPLASMVKLRQLVTDTPPAVDEEAIDKARNGLRRKAADLLQRHGIPAGVQVLSGILQAQLAVHADALAPDLIVLGPGGKPGLRELLLGSTAERVAQKTRHSLLVVKQLPRTSYRRVLVAVDFSGGALTTLTAARSLAPDAEIILLHAFEVPFEGKLQLAGADENTIGHYRIVARNRAMEAMQQLCIAAGLGSVSVKRVVLHGDCSRHIVEQEEALGCDLIAMGKHFEKTLEALLPASVRGHVVGESRGDVLIVV